MGSINSGPKIRNKLGVFKIYGLIDPNSTNFWFYGVSRSYLTNVKHMYIYGAKKDIKNQNRMYKKIKELDYNFDIVHLETLSKDTTPLQARLHLQDNYLSKSDTLNLLTYSPREENKKVKNHFTDYIRIKICDMYIEGYKSKEIAEFLNIEQNRILNVLRRNNVTKQELYNKSLELFKQGKSMVDVRKQNPQLSPYLIRKIRSQAQQDEPGSIKK